MMGVCLFQEMIEMYVWIVDESCTVVDENTKDNRDIFDHGDSQRLTQQDVLELKSKVLEGELEPTALVEALIQNNSSFEKRTDFSKAKYIQRKTKKYSLYSIYLVFII